MARQSGIIKIEGTVDDLTFLKRGGRYFVRRKGGVSRSRMLHDPAFERTRENSNEFAHAAKCATQLRRAAMVLIKKAHAPKLSNRLVSVLFRIKNLDSTSVRGARQVSIGLATPAGKALLTGYDLNPAASLAAVLQAPYVLTAATGAISITDFVPAEMLQYPQYATHVGLTAGFLIVDFESGVSTAALSTETQLALHAGATTVTLTPLAVPTGAGTKLHLLLVAFYQEVNGILYPLQDGHFNSLAVVAVD